MNDDEREAQIRALDKNLMSREARGAYYGRDAMNFILRRLDEARVEAADFKAGFETAQRECRERSREIEQCYPRPGEAWTREALRTGELIAGRIRELNSDVK